MSLASESPKFCQRCGTRGSCHDARPSGQFYRRRYSCTCGHAWTTAEMLVRDDVAMGTPIASDITRMQTRIGGTETIGRVTKALQKLIEEINA